MCIFSPTLKRSVAVATTHFVHCVLTHFSQSQCHKGKQHATSEEEHEWALQDTIQASQQTMGPQLPHTDKDSSDPIDKYEKIIADSRWQTERSKTAVVCSILLVYFHALRPVTQFTPANRSTEALTLVTASNVPGAAPSDDNDDEYSPYAQSPEPDEEFYVPEPGTKSKHPLHDVAAHFLNPQLQPQLSAPDQCKIRGHIKAHQTMLSPATLKKHRCDSMFTTERVLFHPV